MPETQRIYRCGGNTWDADKRPVIQLKAASLFCCSPQLHLPSCNISNICNKTCINGLWILHSLLFNSFKRIIHKVEQIMDYS